MSIYRKVMATQSGDFAFQYGLSVGAGQVYELPAKAVSGIQPNIQVDWGDDSTSTITSESDPNRFHTYVSAGSYTVSIIGNLPGFRVDNNSTYRNLYTSIVDWGNVGIRNLNFYGCINITSIPDGSVGLSRVTQFINTFRSTGITVIPSDLFRYASSVVEFTDTFSFTNITSVPNNLFDVCTQVTSFNSTFNGCSSLASVPNELFRYNTNVFSFSSTFRSCVALNNIPTFQYNTSVTTFASIFNMPTISNGSANWGTVEALWDREPEPLGSFAFRNCTGIANYASIPFNWK